MLWQFETNRAQFEWIEYFIPAFDIWCEYKQKKASWMSMYLIVNFIAAIGLFGVYIAAMLLPLFSKKYTFSNDFETLILIPTIAGWYTFYFIQG